MNVVDLRALIKPKVSLRYILANGCLFYALCLINDAQSNTLAEYLLGNTLYILFTVGLHISRPKETMHNGLYYIPTKFSAHFRVLSKLEF